MNQTLQPEFTELIRAVREESEAIGGFGYLVLRVNLHEGLPQSVETLESVRRRRCAADSRKTKVLTSVR